MSSLSAQSRLFIDSDELHCHAHLIAALVTRPTTRLNAQLPAGFDRINLTRRILEYRAGRPHGNFTDLTETRDDGVAHAHAKIVVASFRADNFEGSTATARTFATALSFSASSLTSATKL